MNMKYLLSYGLVAFGVIGAVADSSVEPWAASGDFRDFGFSRPDTVISLDCGEAVIDNRKPLFYADFRDSLEISLTAKFNTFLTEQALLCKEGKGGDKAGSLTIGFDPGSEQIFAEIMQADGLPCRITAGP